MQSPVPSQSKDASSGTVSAGAATPQHPPIISQDSSSSTGSQPPPDLALNLTSSSVLSSDAAEKSAFKPVLSSTTPARGSGTPLPSATGRSVTATPLRPQATPSASSVGYNNMTADTPQAEAPVTPAVTANVNANAALAPPPVPVSHPPTAATGVVAPPRTPDPVSPEHGPHQSPEIPSSGHGVVLGVQALERQQAAFERKRHEAATPQRVAPTPHPTPAAPRQRQSDFQTQIQNPFEDDENTEPSSMTGSGDHVDLEGFSNRPERPNSIGRIIRSTRKRLSSKDRAPHERGDSYDSDDDDATFGDESRPIIYGYLHKLSRSGKWQRRFFETDGEYLSYYKSAKRTNLLATLDLCKVGEIVIDSSDPTGCTLTIQVADRPYSLRADTVGSCEDWVITLNRIKEARMHIGNVELVTPAYHHPHDLLDRSESMELSARVVVKANRQRTRAVDESVKSWNQLVAKGEKPPDFLSNSPVTLTQPGVPSERPPKRIIAHLPPRVMARWEKRQSVFHTMGRRIVRWAKRMRKLRCVGSENDVQLDLDHHIHPPGHDDPVTSSYAPKTVTVKSSKDSSDKSKVSEDSGASIGSGSVSPPPRHGEVMSHTEWIGKEAQLSTVQKEGTVEAAETDEETRELS